MAHFNKLCIFQSFEEVLHHQKTEEKNKHQIMSAIQF